MNKTLVVLAFILGIAFADLSTITIPATGVTDAASGNMINGAADNDNLGSNVCYVGLFNDDTYPDYAVTNAKGVVYVILGKSSARSAVIDLGDSTATSVSNFLKITTEYSTKTATCGSAGKWKSSTRDSLVIGFPTAGSQNQGEVYIIYHRTTDLTWTAAAGAAPWANSATTGLKIIRTTTPVNDEKVGASIAPAGDLTNDQIDDVLIGAPGGKTVFIIPGLGTATAPTAEYDLGAANGPTNPSIAVIGIAADTDFGTSVDGDFDFNEDNIDDFIVGSPASNKAYVFYGQNNAAFTTVTVAAGTAARFTEITLATTTGTPKFGFDVAHAGDVNGDSIDDVIVSAPGYDSASSTDIGRVYVIFGSDTNTNALAVANIADAAALTATTTQKGYVITGGIGSGALGTTLDGIGDVNEDGTGDFAISAPADSGSRTTFTGKVYVVYGRTTATSAAIDLSLTTGTGYFSSDLGITITGHQGTEFGASLAGVGDVTGDAIDDFVVGAPKSGSIGLASGVTARTANGIVYQFNGQKVSSPKSGFRLEASLLVIVSFFAALMF